MNTLRYASPAHWIQVLREFVGPTHDTADRPALERDITTRLERTLLEQMKVACESSPVVLSEHLEAVIAGR